MSLIVAANLCRDPGCDQSFLCIDTLSATNSGRTFAWCCRTDARARLPSWVTGSSLTPCSTAPEPVSRGETCLTTTDDHRIETLQVGSGPLALLLDVPFHRCLLLVGVGQPIV